MTSAPAPRRVVGFAATAALLLLGLAAFWPTVLSLVHHWQDTDNLTYTHGFMIAAISAWLLWRERARIDACELRPAWPAIALTLLLSLAWYVAWIAALQIGHQVLLPLILLAALAGGLGIAVARRAAFAIGYLYFAIPIWSEINGVLQSATTAGVTLLIRLTGLPAYIEGNFVHVPSGSFEIAGGCSGLHFLIVALAIAALYGELDRERLKPRLQLLAVAAVMAIVMNWLRVYFIILNGHLTDMEGYLVKVDHYKFGWVLFALMLAGFFWVARRMLPPRRDEASVGEPRRGTSRVARAGLAVALAGMAAGPTLAAVAVHRAHGAAAITALTLPPGDAGWSGPEWTNAAWHPVHRAADAEARGEYRKADQWVVAYAASYASQSQGSELIGAGNSVLGPGKWRVIGRETRTAGPPVGAFREIEAAGPDGTRWVIGYVYQVGGRTFVNDLPAKLYYGLAALVETPRSNVVAGAARCDDDCVDARAALAGFFADNGMRLIESAAKDDL